MNFFWGSVISLNLILLIGCGGNSSNQENQKTANSVNSPTISSPKSDGPELSSNQSDNNVAAISKPQDLSGAFSAFYNTAFRAPLTINPLTNSILLSNSDFNGGRTLVSWDAYNLTEFVAQRPLRRVLVTNFTKDPNLINLVSNVYGLYGCLLIYEGVANQNFGKLLQSSLQEGEQDGREYVYTKVESAKFFGSNQSEISCLGGYGETFGAADFNGDGLIDLVVTSYERNFLFKNNGNYQFTDVTPAFLVKTNYTPHVEGVIVADLFKRGNFDIVLNNVIAVHDADFQFHALEPGNGFETPDEGIAISDLDNDGFFEIIRLQPNPPVIRIFKIIAEDNIKLVKTVDINSLMNENRNSVFGIGLGDLFSKGCDDIIIPGGRPNGLLPLIIKNDCSMNFELASLGRADGFFSNQVLVADVDGDTAPDIVSRGSSINDYSFPLLDDSNQPLQQATSEGNFIFINKSLKRNNLQLSLTEQDDVFHASGRTIELSGKNGYKKVFSLNAAAGYLSYGNLRAAGYLELGNCPFTIKVSGLEDHSTQLGCDSILEPILSINGTRLASHSDIRVTTNQFNLLGPFSLSALKSWGAGDGALITYNAQDESRLNLVNTQPNWGYIRKIFTNTCIGTFKLEGNLIEGSTFPRLRVGTNSGVWDIVGPARMNGEFSYEISQKGNIVIDIYNEDPIVNGYSVLASLKAYCSN
jgi:hypothetical protein